MQLVRLDLQGFKSFADRTSVEFGPGITAVVGPNGAGKSNLSDAIRWVLGEASARNLRGERMEDVIFAGSATRRPLPWAEVSLTLDNSDGSLPIAFSEVTLTRRVDRGGAGEYLINRSPCRQRDVVELLHGTGLGRHAFAVLGQGQADELLNARPEELRAVVEEAAGITRYRARCAEAERRLAQAAVAGERLGDLLAERERQLPALAAEARRAERHRVLREELQRRELALFAHELGGARERLQSAAAAAAAAAQAAADAQAHLAAATQRLREAAAAAQAADEAWQRVREREGKLRAQAEAAAQEARLAAALAERLQEEDARLRERAAAAREQLRRWEAEAGQQAERQAALLRAQREAQAALAVAEAAAAAAEARRRELVAEVAACEAELGKTRAERAAAGRAPGPEERAAATAAAERAAAEAETARAELARARQAAEAATARRREAEAALTAARGELARLRARLAEDRERRTAAESRAQALREMVRHGVGLAQGPRTVLQGKAAGEPAFAGVLGALAQLLTVPAELAVAIDAALGGSAQDLVATTAAAAEAAIAALKERRGGRATFLPLDALAAPVLAPGLRELARQPGAVGWAADLVRCDAAIRPAVAHALGRVLVARDLAAARALARASGFRIRIVTLEGDVVHAGGAMTGGWLAGERRGGALGQEAEAARLEAEAAELARATAAHEQALRGAAQRADEAEGQVRRAGAAAAAAAAQVQAAQARLQRAEAEAARSAAAAAALAARGVRDEAALVALAQREAELAEALAAAQARQREAAEAAARSQGELERCRARLEAAGAQLAEHAAWQERLAEERARAVAALDAFAREGERLAGEHGRHLAEAARWRDAAAEAARQAEAAAEEAAAAGVRAHAARQAAAAAAVEREAAEAARQAAERRRAQAEVERVRQEAALQGLGERLRQAYGLDLADLAAVAASERPAADREAAAALRAELEALGPVDPRATDRFAEERGRAEALRRQLADLAAAAAGCRRWLDHIATRMQAAYAETLAAVRREFAAVHTRLFGGGQADLVPAGEGLAIVSQPPGKRLGPLSLLSGGERAMAGLALLLALLRLRPASFCVLDEVEAALDDANVVRFAAFLREWAAAGTQFLVVTHQRATMEAADRLVGVTLGEGGTSRLVSVRLEGAQAVGEGDAG